MCMIRRIIHEVLSHGVVMKFVKMVIKIVPVLGTVFYAGLTTAQTVYCTSPGLPVGCVVRPANVGAPGVGVLPGPGAGAPGPGVAPGVGAPGVGAPGAGAPGVGVAPGAGAGAAGPGLKRAGPGADGAANRGGPVDRAGVR